MMPVTALPRVPRALLLACLLALVAVRPLRAQEDQAADSVQQGSSGELLNSAMLEQLTLKRAHDLDALPEVHYNYYIVEEDSRIKAKLRLWKDIGADQRGKDSRKDLVMFLNRSLLEELKQGDTLIVPTEFDLDMRAYSPFPRYYPGAREFDKLVVIDKSIQAFGAYEHGQLVRWGVVNTGAVSTETPTGRFNFNWKVPERVSSLSPPGEEWLMTWVMNVHEERGIHLHQYEMPTAGPASHGCVRLLDADAKWLYDWADFWEKKTRALELSGGPQNITRQGTTLLILGKEMEGRPLPYTYKKRYPILKMVELPASPWDLPPGSPQQEYFDRVRARKARAAR